MHSKLREALFAAICLLPLFLIAPRAGAAELDMRTSIQPERLKDCVVEDGVLRLPEPLPYQHNGDAIVLEAEDCRSLQRQNERGGSVRAPKASGGRGIAFVSEAVYHFAVRRPGDYTYWQRVWIPRKAYWVHSVQVDDRPPMRMRFGTRKEDEAKVWFWIRGKRVHLDAGVHSLAVRNLHNGKRLDRLVLAPEEDWHPEGAGPPTTPLESVDEGRFVSRPVDPLSLHAWQKVEISPRDGIVVEASTGSGEFRPLPETGRLPGRETPLKVRISLQRRPDGSSPTVRLGAVHYTAASRDFFVLHNDALEMLFHRETGRLCGLRNSRTGRRYLPDGIASTLFELQTKSFDDPAISTLSSDEAELTNASKEDNSLELNYHLAELRVTVRAEVGEDWMSRLRLTVENRSDRDVIGVTFPRLAAARAGASGTDDVLCFPSKTGRLVPRPGAAGSLSQKHPMGAAIGFCDLSDERGGLTLAPLDWPMIYTLFASRPRPDRESIILSLTRRDRVPVGEKRTFTAGVGLHPGDWHAAADWYRDWFDRTAGTPRIPDWVRESDGWVTSPDPEGMAGLGFDHIQMWGQTGYGGCPTYPYPNPNHRPEAWFRDLARRWHALGGHLGVYFHGNGVNPGYTLADSIYGIPVGKIPEPKRPPAWKWFRKNHGYGSDRNPPAKPAGKKVEQPAKHESYPTMCWQGGEWQNYLEKWGLDVYLKEYGLDTPYWDTLGCRDHISFNPHYGHNGEGRGGMARLRWLQKMQEKGTAVRPGFYQIVECGSELLGLAAGQLQSNFLRNLEVARYTHPRQIYYVGHSNGWWNPPKTHLSVCRAFYLNTKLDLIKLTPNVLEVVRCRRWFAPWLYRSRFVDDLGLTLSSPKIKGALHVNRRDGKHALIATFMNWDRIEGEKATIDVGRYLRGDGIRGYRVEQGSEPEPLSPPETPGQWTVPLSPAPVSAVLFLRNPAEARPVAQARQEQYGVRIRVFDPAQKQRTFRVKIGTEEARFDRTEDALLIRNPTPGSEHGPQVMCGRRFDYAEYQKLTRRLHTDITLTEGDLALKTRSLVAPFFPHPGFERKRFDSSHAHSGRRSLRISPGGLRHFPLRLVPGRRYRISLWIRREGPEGKVFANVWLPLQRKPHVFGHRNQPGRWVQVKTTYQMKKGHEQPRLYLYNWQGAKKPAWFDAVRVEDLGPAK